MMTLWWWRQWRRWRGCHLTPAAVQGKDRRRVMEVLGIKREGGLKRRWYWRHDGRSVSKCRERRRFLLSP